MPRFVVICNPMSVEPACIRGLPPIFTTFMITLPVVTANVVEEVASVDRRLLEMGQVYRLSGWESFRSIVIPPTVSHLVAGRRWARAHAQGLGGRGDLRRDQRHRLRHVNYGREILATQMVFAWTLVMVAIMLVADELVFDALPCRLERWR